MSSRSKKSVSSSSTTYAMKTSTPVASQSGSVGTPDSSRRPSSPTVLSRLQEKNELAGLNDRLAVYIEKVRSLEMENSRLTKAMSAQEHTVTNDTSKIKDMFEEELKTARKLLDDISKEKASLQIENHNLKAELSDLRSKLKNREMALSSAEKNVLSISSQLTDANNQKKYWEDEYNKVGDELAVLKRSIGLLKKNLEDETVARVDLENRIQSLREDAAFKARLHEQELTETFTHSRVAVEETDTRLQDEYDSRLREALQQIREENEENIRMMRMETEAVFEKKYGELRAAASQSEGASEKTICEIRSLQRRTEDQADSIGRLKDLVRNYESKIHDLEGLLQAEKESHHASVQALNAQIKGLNKTIEEQMLEYRDLMDMKIKLDNEIGAYRKLLEVEEDRLKETKSLSFGSSRKRKRRDFDFTPELSRDVLKMSSDVSSSFQVTSSSTDVVQFSEVDPEGKFVRLLNSSDKKELPLGGWQVKMMSGDVEVLYKFHRNLILKPSSSVTLWSAGTDKVHSPPSDLVMKVQAWKLADHNTVQLLDQKGEEVAVYEMHRSHRTDFKDVAEMSHSQHSKGWLSFLGVLM